jgi:glutaredoxin
MALSSTTVPQIFIAGRHLGGFTELIARHEGGQLESMLDEGALQRVP